MIVKHTNPCGVASRGDILEAYRLAVKADPVSAFGGIVAFNMEVDEVSDMVIRSCIIFILLYLQLACIELSLAVF